MATHAVDTDRQKEERAHDLAASVATGRGTPSGADPPPNHVAAALDATATLVLSPLE